MSPVEHVEKARGLLSSGAYLIKGGFEEAAGQQAYLAAFHAAMAHIAARTGKAPKTHHGTHTEFARQVNERHELPHEFVVFLSQSYELKDIADYTGARGVTRQEAEQALLAAARIVDTIADLTA